MKICVEVGTINVRINAYYFITPKYKTSSIDEINFYGI